MQRQQEQLRQQYGGETQEQVVYINLPPHRVERGIRKKLDKEFGRGNYDIINTIPLGNKMYKVLFTANLTFKGKKRLKPRR